MLQEAFERYGKNLLQLFLVGLIAAVILAVPGWIIGALGIGAGLSLAALGASLSPAALIAAAVAAVGALLVAALVGLFLVPLAQAGLLGAARDVIAGNPVEPAGFFSQAARSYVPLLLYTLWAGLTWVVFALINIIPVLGTLVFVAAVVCMGPAFFLFAPYAMVTEGLTPGAAYSLAWQCVSKRFGETALSGLILAVCYLVMGVASMILGLIPVIGALAVSSFGLPFIYLLLSMRFVANVRPHLTVPGGQAAPQ